MITNFMKILAMGRNVSVHTDGQTDRRVDLTQLIVAFCKFWDRGCNISKYFFLNTYNSSNLHKYFYFLRCNFANSLCCKSVSIVLFIPWIATKWRIPKSHIWSTLIFWLANEITQMYHPFKAQKFYKSNYNAGLHYRDSNVLNCLETSLCKNHLGVGGMEYRKRKCAGNFPYYQVAWHRAESVIG